jgi:hydroxyacylglutathione hydrolase
MSKNISEHRNQGTISYTNEIIPLRALKDNYIWMLVNKELKQAWVVDPGDATPVIETFNKLELTLSGILITHHHADHTGGIYDLIQYAGEIPIVGSHISPIKYINHRVKDHDEVICSTFHFKAIEIPGHTLDHTAYYGNGSLFSGDTLFSAGCGRIFEGTPQMMFNSLNKLLQLDGNTKLYCGHEYTLANLHFAQQVEPNNMQIHDKIKQVKELTQQGGCSLPSTLTEEKTFNPFFRCTIPEVIEATSKHAGKKLNTPLEVFTCLREWKNKF